MPDAKNSKVTIQIDLECESDHLIKNLYELIDDIENAAAKTDQFYDSTKDHLLNLLKAAIPEIKERGIEEGTAKNDKITSFDDWVGTITLYTLPQHHHPITKTALSKSRRKRK